MTRSAKKHAPARSRRPVSTGKSLPTGERKATQPVSSASVLPERDAKAPDCDGTAKVSKSDSGTKQSRVLAMLRSPAGATIAAMMQATGWQQHSVRGFLAGVVRKRLKLKLTSTKIDSSRLYQIAGGGDANSRQPKRRAA
jgi:hypothetical protein